MTTEEILFWTLGVAAVAAAVGMVTAAKAVYSAMCLGMIMLILAVFYVAQGALFLGIVQVVVYTGAVMMLFLFVLMLVGVESSESLTETIRGQRVAAILAVTGFAVLLIAVVANRQSRVTGRGGGQAGLAEDNVEGLAALIFTRYLWAFEVTSALLITAALGAMVLTHRERSERRMTQRQLSIERFRQGGHPTTLPNPGVYATHNAVDAPALLPDGSASSASVPGMVQPRPVPARSATTSRPRLRLVSPPSEASLDWIDRWSVPGKHRSQG
jgi:NADH-quinone oxidoreductase subunit J